MAGKYSKLSLPPLQEEPAYQEKVEAMKASLASQPDFPQNGSGLAAAYAVVRKRKDELKDQLSEVELELAAVTQMMITQFEAEGTTSLKLATGESVRVQSEPYTVVKDREEFRIWCIANGYERQMTLPWQTANSLVKDLLLEGQPEPPGTQASMRNTVVFTRK